MTLAINCRKDPFGARVDRRRKKKRKRKGRAREPMHLPLRGGGKDENREGIGNGGEERRQSHTARHQGFDRRGYDSKKKVKKITRKIL